MAGNIRGSVVTSKMDDILDTCFDEELFKIPLEFSKRKREKKIESCNPWKYAKILVPIYENHKVDKDEIMNHACQASHKIALEEKTIPEEDRVYIFLLHCVVKTESSCVPGCICLSDCTKDTLLLLHQTTLKERVLHWRTG